MKQSWKVSCLICGLFLFWGSAFGFGSAPYIGGQVGWSQVKEGDGYSDYIKNFNNSLMKRDGRFSSWRAYGGYSFFSLFGLEVGYSRFPENSYKADQISISNKTYAIDLVAKVVFPLQVIPVVPPFFGLYVKGGMAYVNATSTGVNVNGKSYQRKTTGIKPTAGAGLTVSFIENLYFDFSWMMIFGKKEIANASDVLQYRAGIPQANMLTLGAYYKFDF